MGCVPLDICSTSLGGAAGRTDVIHIQRQNLRLAVAFQRDCYLGGTAETAEYFCSLGRIIQDYTIDFRDEIAGPQAQRCKLLTIWSRIDPIALQLPVRHERLWPNHVQEAGRILRDITPKSTLASTCCR